jgi:hypothetical protein
LDRDIPYISGEKADVENQDNNIERDLFIRMQVTQSRDLRIRVYFP